MYDGSVVSGFPIDRVANDNPNRESHIDRAADMTPIVATTEVGRPAADVFTYTTDPRRFPDWQAGVVSGRMDGDRVGARCVTVRRIGGAERPSTSEMVRRDAPRSWAVRGLDGPIR